MSKRSSPESKLRDNQIAIAESLTAAFDTNDLKVIVEALKRAMLSQNVMALAESAGIRRESLYRTFGGIVDPKLGNVIKLLVALNVKLLVIPVPSKPLAPRPKLGRPKKIGRVVSADE